MNKFIAVLGLMIIALITGCQQELVVEEQERLSIGIMLSDVGLGDQSFSDAAFQGLIQARDELGIIFDYRELEQMGSYEQGLQELIDGEHDLIIGLGFMVKDDLEAKAEQNPDQQFVLIDDRSELPNVISVTFKEHEGSFLAGIAAGLATDSGVVGFVGGADVPLINKFKAGFEQGVKSVDSSYQVLVEYANDFGSVGVGQEIARDMIDNEADVLYAAAGLTGVGVLTEAQAQEIYAIGVDSDQYFIAEKAVITSMMKYIDEAVYQVVIDFVSGDLLNQSNIELGLQEAGVGLAPFRLVNEESYQKEVSKWSEDIVSGSQKVEEDGGRN
ncbi:BMP family lipoprotein [Halalkalibacter akibai]|uniref:Basic membrane lipoprotein n=1 Tax=Halalkalibacter akibai (strain ATCC 43226 / DSM 21942 / CIP 109018 / JCM 9157 / 1139) TaxID=1236973 RepID=W4QZ49_HALA3|nr:BMP family ABC transporter substrate-binding protein [Halalkalibacter akibai]GAE37356.1 basic membrane lipoprotein [Halalkalibacter akibai JCM 9157]